MSLLLRRIQSYQRWENPDDATMAAGCVFGFAAAVLRSDNRYSPD